MNEARALRGLLHAIFSGPEAWHGPPVLDVLEGIDAGVAAHRPWPGAHTIQTLVGHMTYWRERVLAALAGEEIGPEAPPEENFPPSAAPDETAWALARERLEASQQALLEKLRTLTPEDLERQVARGGYSLYVLLHGLIHHDLYHCGQVVLLKKAAAARPGAPRDASSQ